MEVVDRKLHENNLLSRLIGITETRTLQEALKHPDLNGAIPRYFILADISVY